MGAVERRRANGAGKQVARVVSRPPEKAGAGIAGWRCGDSGSHFLPISRDSGLSDRSRRFSGRSRCETQRLPT